MLMKWQCAGHDVLITRGQDRALGLIFLCYLKLIKAVLFVVAPVQPRPVCRIYIKAVHLVTPSDVRHNRIRFSYFSLK